MPRATRTNIRSLTRDELINLCERQQFTIKRRGCQISAMYHVISMFHANNPDRRVMPASAAELNIQLEAARTRIRQMIEAGERPAQAPIPSSAKSFGCNVCFEKLGSGDLQPLALSCGHIFCKGCINQLYESGRPKCPSCRTEIQSFVPLYWESLTEVDEPAPAVASSSSASSDGSNSDRNVIDFTMD